jgi:hypothetical protein
MRSHPARAFGRQSYVTRVRAQRTKDLKQIGTASGGMEDLGDAGRAPEGLARPGAAWGPNRRRPAEPADLHCRPAGAAPA